MAYKISYSDIAVIKKIQLKRRVPVKWIVALCAVVLIVGMFHIDFIQNAFIPGDADVTKAAFISFTKELRTGEHLGDAVTTFCKQIIASDVVE